MILGIIGIILSLALLITLAYRGMPVIIAAPIAAVVALVFSGAPILASYTEIFMPALAGFVGQYFPLFLLGAMFGVLMTVTGYAESIARTVARWIGARNALAATVITSALMTYGGISLFVVAFVMFPLARELFRVADIPKRLIPGTIALGIFTFTMTALPGSPQVQNLIPGQFFGTDGFAAPGIGLVGTAMILGLGLAWLEFRRRRLMANGEHFSDASPRRGDGPGAALAGAQAQVKEAETGTSGARMTPRNGVEAFIPLLAVIVVNFGCTLLVFPALNWDYLQEEKFGAIELSSRAGIWAVIIALTVAILVIVAFNIRRFGVLRTAFVDGAKGSMLPIFSTASEVGYGAVRRVRGGLRRGPGLRVQHGRQRAGHLGVLHLGHRRHHGLLLGWHDHRPERLRRGAAEPRRGAGREPGDHAQDDGPGRGRTGHPAALRRGGHPADRLRHDPPPVLQGHLHGHPRHAGHHGRRAHRRGLGGRGLLTRPARPI